MIYLYYHYNTLNTKFIILDTGLDWYPAMNEFKWRQIDWLSDVLKNSDREHIVLCMHIYSNGGKSSDYWT